MNLGSPSVAERLQSQSILLKTLAKAVAAKLRCGLPGVITAFDPVTQFASVQLAIFENLIDIINGGTTPENIPVLKEVLVMFPGDKDWCLTFPNLVGAECYVCFADMCTNAWETHGLQKDSSGKYVPLKQEIVRRHDLSDGFAILTPRSQPNRIQDFSTTAVELRSMDNNTKLSMDEDIQLKSNGQLHIDGTMGTVVGGVATSHASLPIYINGVRYYIWVSPSP